MTYSQSSFSTHSTSDDEESPTIGLLEDKSSIKIERRGSSKPARLFRLYFVLLHLVLFSLALCLVMIQWAHPYWKANHELVEGSTWSPIREFVQYEVRDRDTHGHQKVQKYAGRPTEEKDKAWDHLIKREPLATIWPQIGINAVSAAYFNATLQDLERAGESLDNVTELTGGGYLASIGVFHELHCVRQLRFYIYKERYYPNLSDSDTRYLQIHLDHCIETLREAVMCNGNTALISFYWDNPNSSQPAAQSNARSKCALWDSIERWGYSRMVSTSPDFQRPPAPINGES
ncbi:hypothetical protein F5X98DRAFT_390409 [Xylaria grammica]|nr:hypothetical protein F5X98DRAFT_390409 [Xylaria grammica]